MTVGVIRENLLHIAWHKVQWSSCQYFMIPQVWPEPSTESVLPFFFLWFPPTVYTEAPLATNPSHVSTKASVFVDTSASMQMLSRQPQTGLGMDSRCRIRTLLHFLQLHLLHLLHFNLPYHLLLPQTQPWCLASVSTLSFSSSSSSLASLEVTTSENPSTWRRTSLRWFSWPTFVWWTLSPSSSSPSLFLILSLRVQQTGSPVP